jgi:hypothetical protein
MARVRLIDNLQDGEVMYASTFVLDIMIQGIDQKPSHKTG